MGRSTQEEPRETPVAGLAKHSLIYSIAPLLQRFVALALVRLYTDVLNEAQYGVLQMTDLLFVALIQISGTNLLSGVVRFYFDEKEPRDRGAVVSSATLFLAAVSWTLVGIGILFREPLAAFLFEMGDLDLANDDLVACLVVALATIPLALSSEASFRYLQIHQRSGLITTLRVSKSALEMGLKVWFLLGLEWGVIGFLAATLIGELLTNAFLTVWVLRRTGIAFSWRVLRPMLVYAAPLVPIGLCQMGLNQIDRLLLKHLGPADDAMNWLGIYGLGYQIGFLVQMVVVGSFMQIWQPWIFGTKDEERRRGLVTQVSTWALFTVGAVSIALMLFSHEAVRILSGDPAYWDAFRVVPIVVAAYVFFALNGLAQVPMFIAKRNWPMLWVNLAALAVNVGLNFVLIPRLAYAGAAYATLASFAVLGMLGQVLAARSVGARFEWSRMAGMLALVLATMVTALWIDEHHSSRHAGFVSVVTLWKGAIFAAALLAIWAVLLRQDERAWIVAKFRSRLGR